VDKDKEGRIRIRIFGGSGSFDNSTPVVTIGVLFFAAVIPVSESPIQPGRNN
jgi:hypothetical protein